MEETVFNLFVYVEEDYVTELGVVRHRLEGTDDQKLALLQAHVPSDSRAALRLAIPPRHLISYTDGEPPSLQYATFRNMMLVGQHLDLFEDAFEGMAASDSPLVCVTPVVGGEPRIEEVIRQDFAAGDHAARIRSHAIAPAYLKSYLTENGFDFPRLFNDDFFDAIRITYNKRRYVSSLKLLVSSIDTAAYLEFGDKPGIFQGFLDRFANLATLGITPSELWELRNSLLHMTNAESRRVVGGMVSRLSFYVGELPDGHPREFDGTKHFNLMGLMKAVAESLENWLRSLNGDRARLANFFDRYDKVYSDARLDLIVFDRARSEDKAS